MGYSVVIHVSCVKKSRMQDFDGGKTYCGASAEIFIRLSTFFFHR